MSAAVSPMPWASNPMPVDRPEILSTIVQIYSAIETPGLWPSVLESISDLVEGEHVLLFANYGDSIADDIQAMACTDPNIWRPYREYYASRNVWTERCDQIFPAGSVRYSHHAICDAELSETEFFTDFLEPNGMAYGFGVEIPLPHQPTALLSSLRSPEMGPFEESDGCILSALLPHLQRALRIHGEISRLRKANQGFERALDAFDRAVIGVDVNGRILFLNQTACQLLARADGLRTQNGRLAADLPSQDAELKSFLVQSAVFSGAFSSTGATLVERSSGKPPLRLTFLPFANNFLDHIPELATLIFVDDPAAKPHSRAAALRALFRLSPSEARLTDLLACGSDLAEASELLNMSQETARFHLKSVFRKTGVNRQASLVQLVLGLPGISAPPPLVKANSA